MRPTTARVAAVLTLVATAVAVPIGVRHSTGSSATGRTGSDLDATSIWSGSAAIATSTTTTPDPATLAAERLAVSVAAAEAVGYGRDGSVGFAVIDLTTGVTLAGGDTTPIRSASVVKVTVAIAFLRTVEAAEREVTDGELRQLTAMIEWSDNDETTALWNAAGGVVGLRDVVDAAGLTGTTADTEGRWGFTLTTASDQVRLLRALRAGELLDDAHTGLVLDLMRNVTESQRWGLAEVAPADSVPAVKNGWYPDTDEPVWRVNCIAIVDGVGAGSGLGLAVMTRYPQDLGEEYGHETCREIGAAIFAGADG